MTGSAIAGTRPDEAGAASGALNVAHQLGGALGLSAITAISAVSVGAGAAAVGARFDAALLAASAFVLLAALVALALIPLRRAHPVTPQPQTAVPTTRRSR